MINIDQLLKGERRTLAKAITLIESQKEDDQKKANELLEKILPHTGEAFRVGVSGVPGVGKSTFLDGFGSFLCEKKENKVAVLAIDPSSPVSGGSLLGDKTRMESLSRFENSFIRPTPTSGLLGGVAQKTKEVLLLCEAAGFNWVFIETVGVGQSEFKVSQIVDFFTLLALPNAGDELQGIKKGILELADLIFINKCDGSLLHSGKTTKSQLQSALSFSKPKEDFWQPPILMGSSLKKIGFDELLEAYQKYFTQTKKNTYLNQKRQQQNEQWFQNLFEEGLKRVVFENEKIKQAFQQSLEQIKKGEQSTPYQQAMKILGMIKINS